MGKEKEQKELSKRELRRKRRIKNQIISYVGLAVCVILLGVGIFLGGTQIFKYMDEKKQQKLMAEVKKQEAESSEEAESVTVTETETEVESEEELLEELINTYIADMTVEEKVAGLFLVNPESITGVQSVVKAGEGTKTALEKYPVGGMIYFSKNIQSEKQLTEMIANTVSYSKYPLFIAVDEEGGKVSRIANSKLGVDKVPAMAEIGKEGDVTKAEAAGKTIGSYLGNYGFNLDFAPVADVLTNENNPIGDRAFSADKEVTSNMVKAFVGGLQSTGISACVKHFPGHGDTKGDSHEGAAVTEKTIEEMRETEFLPFKAGIEAGVDFVMVGHITAPKIIGDDTPSDLSSMIVSEVLRNELGYQGIVVTDAMNMKAITDKYSSEEAAVMALQAGVDMILMPEDFEKAYQGVLEAIKANKITEDRINESLHRIYRIKYKDAIQE